MDRNLTKGFETLYTKKLRHSNEIFGRNSNISDSTQSLVLKLAKQRGLSAAGIKLLSDSTKMAPGNLKISLTRTKPAMMIKVPRVGTQNNKNTKKSAIAYTYKPSKRSFQRIKEIDTENRTEVRSNLERQSGINSWKSKKRELDRSTMQKSYLSHPRDIR